MATPRWSPERTTREASHGKRYDYRDRLTDVWMKVGGAWQVIASHYSVPVKE